MAGNSSTSGKNDLNLNVGINISTTPAKLKKQFKSVAKEIEKNLTLKIKPEFEMAVMEQQSRNITQIYKDATKTILQSIKAINEEFKGAFAGSGASFKDYDKILSSQTEKVKSLTRSVAELSRIKEVADGKLVAREGNSSVFGEISKDIGANKKFFSSTAKITEKNAEAEIANLKGIYQRWIDELTAYRENVLTDKTGTINFSLFDSEQLVKARQDVDEFINILNKAKEEVDATNYRIINGSDNQNRGINGLIYKYLDKYSIPPLKTVDLSTLTNQSNENFLKEQAAQLELRAKQLREEMEAAKNAVSEGAGGTAEEAFKEYTLIYANLDNSRAKFMLGQEEFIRSIREEAVEIRGLVDALDRFEPLKRLKEAEAAKEDAPNLASTLTIGKTKSKSKKTVDPLAEITTEKSQIVNEIDSTLSSINEKSNTFINDVGTYIQSVKELYTEIKNVGAEIDRVNADITANGARTVTEVKVDVNTATAISKAATSMSALIDKRDSFAEVQRKISNAFNGEARKISKIVEEYNKLQNPFGVDQGLDAIKDINNKIAETYGGAETKVAVNIQKGFTQKINSVTRAFEKLDEAQNTFIWKQMEILDQLAKHRDVISDLVGGYGKLKEIIRKGTGGLTEKELDKINAVRTQKEADTTAKLERNKKIAADALTEIQANFNAITGKSTAGEIQKIIENTAAALKRLNSEFVAARKNADAVPTTETGNLYDEVSAINTEGLKVQAEMQEKLNSRIALETQIQESARKQAEAKAAAAAAAAKQAKDDAEAKAKQAKDEADAKAKQLAADQALTKERELQAKLDTQRVNATKIRDSIDNKIKGIDPNQTDSIDIKRIKDEVSNEIAQLKQVAKDAKALLGKNASTDAVERYNRVVEILNNTLNLEVVLNDTLRKRLELEKDIAKAKSDAEKATKEAKRKADKDDAEAKRKAERDAKSAFNTAKSGMGYSTSRLTSTKDRLETLKGRGTSWGDWEDIPKMITQVEALLALMSRVQQLDVNSSISQFMGTITDEQKASLPEKMFGENWQNEFNAATTEIEKFSLLTKTVTSEADKLFLKVNKHLVDGRIEAALQKNRKNLDNLIHQIKEYMAMNPNIASNKTITAQLNSVMGAAGEQDADFNALSASFAKIRREAQALNLEGRDAIQTIVRLVTTKWNFMAAGFALNSMRRAMTMVYQNALDINAAMTQLQIVTNASATAMNRYSEAAAKAAKDSAASVSAILDSTTTYARLGYSGDESIDLAKYTAMYSNVSGSSVDEGTTALTSIMKGYDVSTKDLPAVLDKIINVGNNFAISSSELGVGMQNAGSALNAAGNTIDESMALLVGANASVQDISKASTALRTVTARITGSSGELEKLAEEGLDVEDAIKNQSKYRDEILAETKGAVDILQADGKTYKSTFQILRELSGVWNELDDMAQKVIIEDIAGTRNQNVMLSVINNWEDVEGAVKSASNSMGDMEKANNIYLESMRGKLNQLTAAFQTLSKDALSTNIFGGVISGATGLVNVLDGLVNILADMPVLIPAAVAGFSAFNAVNSSASNFKSAIDTAFATIKENPNDVETLAKAMIGLDEAQQKVFLSKVAMSGVTETSIRDKMSELKVSQMLAGSSEVITEQEFDIIKAKLAEIGVLKISPKKSSNRNWQMRALAKISARKWPPAICVFRSCSRS